MSQWLTLMSDMLQLVLARRQTFLKFFGHSDGDGLELRLQHCNHAAHVEWIFFLDQ